MKLEVGDYIRTKKGKIAKIVSKEDVYGGLHREEIVFILDIGERLAIHSKKVINSSKKINDLVGVGDFIDGMRVVAKDSDDRLYVAEDLGQPYDREFYNGCFEYTLLDERYKIKSILTKEQFESMAYEVKE